MSRYIPEWVDLTEVGFPFKDLESAYLFAERQAVATGQRQRLAYRSVGWRGHLRRWVVTSDVTPDDPLRELEW